MTYYFPDLDYSRSDVFSSSDTTTSKSDASMLLYIFKYSDKNGLGEKVCRSMFPFKMGVASIEKLTFLQK